MHKIVNELTKVDQTALLMSRLLEFPGKTWCTDDSFRASFRCNAHRVLKTMFLLCRVSVSYTHLTLPTIYSV